MQTNQRIERIVMTNAIKTWFITGTSSGFGRAFADHALARGHNVVATARRIESLADLVASAPDRVPRSAGPRISTRFDQEQGPAAQCLQALELKDRWR